MGAGAVGVGLNCKRGGPVFAAVGTDCAVCKRGVDGGAICRGADRVGLKTGAGGA